MKIKYIYLILIVPLLLPISARADIAVFTPIISTNPITENSDGKADSGGTINLSESDPDVTVWGICWNTSGAPTIADNKEENTGTIRNGSFTERMNGLDVGTVYYVRAYAINSDDTYYGNEVVFTAVPTMQEWALIIMGAILTLTGAIYIHRKIIV